MSTSLEELLREVVQETLRKEVHVAVREAIARVLPEMLSHSGANDGASGAMTQPGSLLTVREVAVELKVTEPTVREWIKSGDLLAQRLGGRGQKRLLRVRRGDIDAFRLGRDGRGAFVVGSLDEQAKNILSAAREKRARPRRTA